MEQHGLRTSANSSAVAVDRPHEMCARTRKTGAVVPAEAGFGGCDRVDRRPNAQQDRGEPGTTSDAGVGGDGVAHRCPASLPPAVVAKGSRVEVQDGVRLLVGRLVQRVEPAVACRRIGVGGEDVLGRRTALKGLFRPAGSTQGVGLRPRSGLPAGRGERSPHLQRPPGLPLPALLLHRARGKDRRSRPPATQDHPHPHPHPDPTSTDAGVEAPSAMPPTGNPPGRIEWRQRRRPPALHSGRRADRRRADPQAGPVRTTPGARCQDTRAHARLHRPGACALAVKDHHIRNTMGHSLPVHGGS